MKLKITQTKTLEQIQKEFQKEFPFLKIEFFKKSHKQEEPSAKKDLLSNSLALSELTSSEGEIEFNVKTKVGELEQEFKKRFGLNMQVFRKSGSVWLETSKTDDWTLEEQVESAKESETQFTYTANYVDKKT